MTKNALILLADGCEETEAVTVFDLLIRAGINVVTASITEQREIHCSRGINLIADTTLSAVADTSFEIVILPGGVKGAENFRDSPRVIEKIQQMHEEHRWVAAICATPAFVLQHHHLFPNAKMTGFPQTQSHFPADVWVNARAYCSEKDRLITSQGPGTSIDFALMIIAILTGKETAQDVAKQLVLPAGIYDYT